MSTEKVVFYREQLKMSERHWEYAGVMVLSKEKYKEFYEKLEAISPTDAHELLNPKYYGVN